MNSVSGAELTVMLVVVLAVSSGMGYWAGRIGARNNRSFGFCFLLGFLLGLIGVLIVYLIGQEGATNKGTPAGKERGSGGERRHRVCGKCGRLIPADSRFCEYCEIDISKPTSEE